MFGGTLPLFLFIFTLIEQTYNNFNCSKCDFWFSKTCSNCAFCYLLSATKWLTLDGQWAVFSCWLRCEPRNRWPRCRNPRTGFACRWAKSPGPPRAPDRISGFLSTCHFSLTNVILPSPWKLIYFLPRQGFYCQSSVSVKPPIGYM